MSNIIHTYYCSFCGKDQGQVEILIIAHKESRLGLCDGCISHCNDVIAAYRAKKETEPTDEVTK